MAIDVKIPPMGESITGGLLATWLVKDGAAVRKGQPIFSLETDKITSEGMAEADGTLKINVAAGSEVKIGEVVAQIIPGAVSAASPAPAAAPTQPAAPAAKAATAAVAPTAKTLTLGDVSPAVRRLAAETGIDPSGVTGTGKAGRVTKGDMLSALAAGGTPPTTAPMVAPTAPTPSSPAPSAAPTPAASVRSPETRVTRRKMTPLRRKIAERLVMAKSETAMLTTFNEVNMAAVMEFRKRYGEEFLKRHGVKLGFMSFFCKAVVQALKEVPQVNTSLEGEEVVENHFYDIGVAVGTDKGLMVPVVRNVDALSFAEIEKSIGEYGKRARDGKITMADLNGGVFTISNGGIYGSMLSTPILNHPQAAILGLHNITERPVAENGQVVIRPMMYLALSYDHRLIDGKEAVTFLVKVRDAIQDPQRLLFGA